MPSTSPSRCCRPHRSLMRKKTTLIDPWDPTTAKLASAYLACATSRMKPPRTPMNKLKFPQKSFLQIRFAFTCSLHLPIELPEEVLSLPPGFRSGTLPRLELGSRPPLPTSFSQRENAVAAQHLSSAGAPLSMALRELVASSVAFSPLVSKASSWTSTLTQMVSPLEPRGD